MMANYKHKYEEQNTYPATSGSNVFMTMIHDQTTCTTLRKLIKHKKELKKFRSDIIDGSPGFGLLWKMADFIKIAEEVFFYNNSLENTTFNLYSSRAFARNENGFKIVNNITCNITVKLQSNSQKVLLEVENVKTGLRTHMSFTKEQWDNDPTLYHEMLLETVISIINSKIITLFDYCYYCHKYNTNICEENFIEFYKN